MIRDDKVYLKHILDSIRFIEKHCNKITMSVFIRDKLLQNAMVRLLEIIGEAAKLISKDTKSKLSGVQWNKIIAMRNTLTHEYFGVDLKIVWSTIHEELPKLKKEITAHLKFLRPTS